MTEVDRLEEEWQALKADIQSYEPDDAAYRLFSPPIPDQSRLISSKERLLKLLETCVALGGETSTPAERSTLQWIARDIADALFARFDIFQPSAIDPYRSRSAHTWSGTYYNDPWPDVKRELFGRDNEKARLADAWCKAQKGDRTVVSVLVGWTGVGKTSLVTRWLEDDQLWAKQRKPDRIFAWSFGNVFSGSQEPSVDQFLDEALRRFGDSQVACLAASWNYATKGQRLAEMILERPTILVLDSFECVQEQPEGRISDPAVRALLTTLADGRGQCLCVVTTRTNISDLQRYDQRRVQIAFLGPLSKEAGADYLKHLGVGGANEERMQVAENYNGHPLTLKLVAGYLVTMHRGDIRSKDRIPGLLSEPQDGPKASALIEEYERWFQGKPEQQVLYMLGLFDHPCGEAEIRAVFGDRVIAGLTDQLDGPTEQTWLYALKRLQELYLVSRTQPGDRLDCHPLVREYFATAFQRRHPSSWHEAHGRLQRHFSSLPAGEHPTTVNEMRPLYYAVRHGCLAGNHQDVWDEIYIHRIQRGEAFFNTRELGAVSDDLRVLGHFFHQRWLKPSPGFPEEKRGLLLHHVGFDLRELGRLTEAVEVLEAALRDYQRAEVWHQATRAAGHLSNVYLTLGNLEKAEHLARMSLELADRSKDPFEKLRRLAALGSALHQRGCAREAEDAFRQAESLQQQVPADVGYHYLYSVRGFQYCDLLLDEGKSDEVLLRAKETLRRSTEQKWLLDMALDHLSIWRANAIQEWPADSQQPKQPDKHLDIAIDLLRGTDYQGFYAQCLLQKAGLHQRCGDVLLADKTLAEAAGIASQSGMRLLATDVELRRTQLFLARGDIEPAKESLQKAAALIEETGYHRRDLERLLHEARLAKEVGNLEGTRCLVLQAQTLMRNRNQKSERFSLKALESEIAIDSQSGGAEDRAIP